MDKIERKLTIISWNVNGIKARLEAIKNLVRTERPDILCLQEVRAKEPYAYLDSFPGYRGFANADNIRPGHAGVAIYISKHILDVTEGINFTSDQEGRIIWTDICGVRIISVYMPSDPLERYHMICELVPLCMGEPACVICGDFNIAAANIDHHRLFSGRENCRPVDKAMMTSLQHTLHMKDPYREMYPLSIAYTYWPYMGRCREKNIGMRIDYTLVSENIPVLGVEILGGIWGSDHCPISVTIHVDSKKED